MKDKSGITITNAFQKIIDECTHKPNKIWVDKDSEFYNRSIKSWLGNNDIEMYSTHNEEKSIVAERFIRTLKNKFRCIKNVYIDKLDDIVNKYNNTYQSIIKIKPVDVKSNTFLNSSKEINEKDPNFKIADSARISKYKNIFAKVYVPNWYEEVFFH